MIFLDQLGELLLGSVKPARQFANIARIQNVENETHRIFNTPLPELRKQNQELKLMAGEAQERKQIGISNFQYLGQIQSAYHAVTESGLRESQKYNQRQQSLRSLKLKLLETSKN